MYIQWNITHKKEGNKTNCCNMDGHRDYHTSEIGQTKKDKYYMISLTCGVDKIIQVDLHKIEIDSQTQKTNFWLPKGRGMGERAKLGVWD